MFDWFSSQIAIGVAVIILISAVIGYFAYINASVEKLEFQSYADEISDAVDKAAATNENFTTTITFDHNSKGVYVNPLFKDNGYDITISSSGVFISQGSYKGSAEFDQDVHVWKPTYDINQTKKTVMDAKDIENGTMEFTSGHDFKLENKRLTVDLVMEYHLFIYMAKDA